MKFPLALASILALAAASPFDKPEYVYSYPSLSTSTYTSETTTDSISTETTSTYTSETTKTETTTTETTTSDTTTSETTSETTSSAYTPPVYPHVYTSRSSSVYTPSYNPYPSPTPDLKMCTRICAAEPIDTCGEGWVSEQMGNCWACCKE